MLMASLAIIFGLILLVWSADRFVEGSAATARYFGMPPLLIGMVVVGFGTSAPELTVSVLAALQGNAGIALGNAYGSNITNIALILGISALINPLVVHSQVLRKELPILLGVTALAAFQLWNGYLSRWDAWVLLFVFAIYLFWSVREALRHRSDTLAQEVEVELKSHPLSLRAALLWVGVGLVLLIISSRILVWGAVSIAHALGVSDLIIGLTIVAVGTSLPELASSVMAARKGEHDIAVGNIIGSNLFNTLMVVGLAGVLRPLEVPHEVFSRDIMVMALVTLALFAMGYDKQGEGKITRLKGGLLVLVYLGYTAFLWSQT